MNPVSLPGHCVKLQVKLMADQAHNADEAFRRVSEAYQHLRSRSKGPAAEFWQKKLGALLNSIRPIQLAAPCVSIISVSCSGIQKVAGHTTFDLQHFAGAQALTTFNRYTLNLYS